MAVRTYKPPENTCWCTISVGGGDRNKVAVVEISSLGAVVGLKGELRRHEYADVVLEVSGHQGLTLFAHVVNVRSSLVHLRWLHFEPGEEAALGQRLLKMFEGIAGVALEDSSGKDFAWRQEQGTRRVVRPRKDAPAPEGTPDAEAPATPQGTDALEAKSKTRRVVRPRRPADADPAATPGPAAASPGSGRISTRRQVVQPRKPADTSDSSDDEYAALDARGGDDSALAQSSPDAQPGPAQSAPVKAKTGWRDRAPAPPESQEDVTVVATDRHLANVPSVPEDQDLNATGRIRDEASRKILSRARTVQASELAARHDKVRVLNMSTIKALIKESVAEALVDINTGMSADRLAEEVEKRVDEQLAAFKAEKDDVEARAKRLEEELVHARQAIERERARAIEASSFTVSESGLVDLERRLERLVATAIRRNGVNDTLADELRGMVAQLLDDERDKIADNARKAQADTIELLERKIARLSTTLTESQKERERQQRTLAAMEKSGGVGLRNVMTAGLDDDDPEAERKKALMKEIIEQNRAMREAYLKQHGELPGAPSRARQTSQPTATEELKAPPSEDPLPPEQPQLADPEVPTDLIDEEEYTGPPEVDPDDLPWDGSDFSSEIDDDSPIKKISVSVSDAAAKAPPLAIRRSASDDTPASAPISDEHDRTATEVDSDEVNASPEMDPDDLPWEPPSEAPSSEDDGSTIKKISPTVHREPPPLQRRS
ncbi:MAG: hypothetical protein EA402_08270 [Planctomycetota bacterium]|nr:MAG: hypothetical protein EA402_08270 [Planctomycetota bacterium]